MRAESNVGKRRLILLQSIIALWLGTFLLLFPKATFRSLIYVVGIYLILDGGMTILERSGEKSKVYLALGIIAVVVGILALTNPGLFGFPLISILAFWALIHGLINLGDLISLRRNKQVALWLGLSGIVMLALALWIFGHIGAGTLFILRWIGIFGVIYGYTLLGLSYELKRTDEKSKSSGDQAVDSKRVA